MSEERIEAIVASSWGTHRVLIDLGAGTLEIERRVGGQTRYAKAPLSEADLDVLRPLAAAVRQEEQELVQGDFYAMGEERLRIELAGRTVELHNASDRLRTPHAKPLLEKCWDLAAALLPRTG